MNIHRHKPARGAQPRSGANRHRLFGQETQLGASRLGVPLGSKLVGWRRQTSKSSKVCRGTLLRLQSCEILKTHKKVKTLLQLSPSSKCSKVSRHVRPIRAHTCCKMARRARPKQNFFKILKSAKTHATASNSQNLQKPWSSSLQTLKTHFEV